MAYTKLPATPLLEELLELDELELELEELEDELDELEVELEELDELDDELDELLEDEDPVPGSPPQAINRVNSEKGINCRIFKVKSSKVVGFVNRYCEPRSYSSNTSDAASQKYYGHTIIILELAWAV